MINKPLDQSALRTQFMFKYLIVISLLVCFGCSNGSNNSDSIPEPNSGCTNPNNDFVCWTILDDSNGDLIVGASILLIYDIGFGDFIMTDTASNGLACFCFPSDKVVSSGYVRADGYEQMEMTGITPSEISTVRLIPLN